MNTESKLANSQQTTSILIVEDFPIVREGFREILKKVEGVKVAGTAASAEQAFSFLEENTVDVVLMDIGLPGMLGTEATAVICDRWPETRVLALTTYGDCGKIEKMLRARATGYVLKDAECEELIKAIAFTTKGKSYFSNKVSNILLKRHLRSPAEENRPSGADVSRTNSQNGKRTF